MSVSPDAFRQALAQFASGVTVVTAATTNGGKTGVTVSAFCSVSLEPPLILVCLDATTTNLESYVAGEGFCVNILAAGQDDVSNGFASPDPMPAFERTPHDLGLYGAPILSGALATLQCRREEAYPAGDHTIIIGRVETALWRNDAEPLIYAGGAYRALSPEDGGT